MPKPGAKKVKAPKEVWVNVNDQQPGMSHWVCAAKEEIAEVHRFKSEKATRYLRADITPPSASEEGRLKERIVKRAMIIYRNAMRMDTALDNACEALYLHRRSTRAKAGGKGER